MHVSARAASASPVGTTSIPYGSYSHYTAKAWAVDASGKPYAPIDYSFTTSWNDSGALFYICPLTYPTLCINGNPPANIPEPYFLNVVPGLVYDVELFYIDNTQTPTAYSYLHDITVPAP